MANKDSYEEFVVRDKDFVKFLILRLFAFAVDYLLVSGLVMIIRLVLPMTIPMAFTYIFVFGALYNTMLVTLFGWTIGLLVTKLKIVHKSGYFTTNFQKFLRGCVNVFYYLPFIGYIFIVANAFIVIVFKGKSVADYLSRTITVSDYTYSELRKIEEEFLQDLKKNRLEKGEKYD